MRKAAFLALVAACITGCGTAPAASIGGSSPLIASATPSRPATSTLVTPSPALATVRPALIGVEIDVGLAPLKVYVFGTEVWVGGDSKAYRINPKTNEVVHELGYGKGRISRGGDIGMGFGSLWVPVNNIDQVRRIDVETGAVEADISAATYPDEIAATAEAVWVSLHRSGDLGRIDPADNTLTKIDVGADQVEGLATTAESVWVSDPDNHEVIEIDPATNEVRRRMTLQGAACLLSVIGAQLWANACSDEGPLLQVLDTTTGEWIGSLDMDSTVSRPVMIDGRVFVSVFDAGSSGEGQLLAIDPESLEIVESVAINQPGHRLDVGFDSLWISYDRRDIVLRVPISGL